MSRGLIEFIGATLLSLSVAALAFVSGALPVLAFTPQTLAETTLRLVLILLIGAILLTIALRREGRNWRQVIVVPLTIIAVALAFIFVPLWFYFWYLHPGSRPPVGR